MNKNQRATFIFFTFILSVSIYSLFDTDEPISQLKKYYKNCEYEKAIQLADRILKNPNIEKYDKSQSYIIKGVSEYSSNQFLNAKMTFMEYLLTDNNATIDEKEVSPKIVDFFNEIKSNLFKNNI